MSADKQYDELRRAGSSDLPEPYPRRLYKEFLQKGGNYIFPGLKGKLEDTRDWLLVWASLAVGISLCIALFMFLLAIIGKVNEPLHEGIEVFVMWFKLLVIPTGLYTWLAANYFSPFTMIGAVIAVVICWDLLF